MKNIYASLLAALLLLTGIIAGMPITASELSDTTGLFSGEIVDKSDTYHFAKVDASVVEESLRSRENLALGALTTAGASSSYNEYHLPANAIDGRTDTAWSSREEVTSESFFIDLGDVYTLDTITIKWNGNEFSKTYMLLAAIDPGVKVFKVHGENNGMGGTETITGNITCRYIGISCHEKIDITKFSIREFEVYGRLEGPTPTPSMPTGAANIALNKKAFCSDYYNESFNATKAIDGDKTTMWGNLTTGVDWIYLDLKQPHNIYKVGIDWDVKGYAKDFLIYFSHDRITWHPFKNIKNNTQSLTEYFCDYTYQYIGIYCAKKNVGYYAIKEIEVMGMPTIITPPPTPSPTQTPVATIKPGHTNLALHKIYFSSSDFSPEYDYTKACDGDDVTYWKSLENNKQQSLMLDLGLITDISAVRIKWHSTGFATHYIVKISDDAQNWHPLDETTTGNGGVETLFTGVKTRYLTLDNLTNPNAAYFAIHELEVYGSQVPSTPTPTATPSPSPFITPTPTPSPTSLPPTPYNVALYKNISTSSTLSAAYTGANSVDGSTGTSWCSALPGQYEWLDIDLQLIHQVTELRIHWNNAGYAVKYELAITNNYKDYVIIHTNENGNGTIETYNFGAGSQKMNRLRIYMHTKGSGNTYFAIDEIELIGVPLTPQPDQTPVPNFVNWALTKHTNVSSVASPAFIGSMAVDGIEGTYWQSDSLSNTDWIIIDLGQPRSFSKTLIQWGDTGYAKSYILSTSHDMLNWDDYYTQSNSIGNTDIIYKHNTCRYIRCTFLEKGDAGYYAVKELQIIGEEN